MITIEHKMVYLLKEINKFNKISEYTKISEEDIKNAVKLEKLGFISIIFFEDILYAKITPKGSLFLVDELQLTTTQNYILNGFNGSKIYQINEKDYIEDFSEINNLRNLGIIDIGKKEVIIYEICLTEAGEHYLEKIRTNTKLDKSS